MHELPRVGSLSLSPSSRSNSGSISPSSKRRFFYGMLEICSHIFFSLEYVFMSVPRFVKPLLRMPHMFPSNLTVGSGLAVSVLDLWLTQSEPEWDLWFLPDLSSYSTLHFPPSGKLFVPSEVSDFSLSLSLSTTLGSDSLPAASVFCLGGIVTKCVRSVWS